MTFSWSDAGVLLAILTINLRGLNFLFLITFILGLYALHRLAPVHEEGSVGERVVLEELREEIFDSVGNVASFSSLRQVVIFSLTGVASASRVVRRRGGGKRQALNVSRRDTQARRWDGILGPCQVGPLRNAIMRVGSANPIQGAIHAQRIYRHR